MKIKSIMAAAVLSIALATSGIAGAQSSTQKAQAHYFAALEAFDSGDYQGALDGVQKAEAISGKTGDVLLKLEIKALYNLGRYQEAKSTLNELYNSGPSDQSKREMASILLEIDEKIESQKQEEIRAAQERREASRLQAEAEAKRQREFEAIDPYAAGVSLRTRVNRNIASQIEQCFQGKTFGRVSHSERVTVWDGTPGTVRYDIQNIYVDDVDLARSSKKLKGLNKRYEISLRVAYGGRKKLLRNNSGQWQRIENRAGDDPFYRLDPKPYFSIALENNSVSLGAVRNLNINRRELEGSFLDGEVAERVANLINNKLERQSRCLKSIEMNAYEKSARSKSSSLFNDGFHGLEREQHKAEARQAKERAAPSEQQSKTASAEVIRVASFNLKSTRKGSRNYVSESFDNWHVVYRGPLGTPGERKYCGLTNAHEYQGGGGLSNGVTWFER